MKKISSIDNNLIKDLYKMSHTKNKDNKQFFVIEGWHLLEVALKQNLVTTILLLEDEKAKKKISNFNIKEINTYLVSTQVIKKLAHATTPQSVMAVCKKPSFLETSFKNVIILDNIQNPSNLGAILRVCEAFAIDKIFISKNSVSLYNHKVLSSSQGASLLANVTYCDLKKIIKELKEQGFTIFSTFLHKLKAITLDKIKFSEKNAIIFGNEAKGISEELYNLVNHNFVISTTKRVESLNLATSVAITCYCLFTKDILELNNKNGGNYE